MTGGSDDLLVRARSTLLDALVALHEQRESIIVIGAQAIYLHTGMAPVAVAEATKDSDLAVDARSLRDDPLIEAAMKAAGFSRDLLNPQPGRWMSPSGIPVDLMVPEAISGDHGRRTVDTPPHDPNAMRWAVGLEAAVVDNSEMEVTALSADDRRRVTARVAGPAALLVAKMHKIGERQNDPNPKRVVDKDAYDVYRLLVAIPTATLSASLARLLDNALSGAVTASAMEYLRALFAAGPDATGSQMAGRTEQDVGNPETVAASCAALASDLLAALDGRADEPTSAR
jgi:hypothetical protein